MKRPFVVVALTCGVLIAGSGSLSAQTPTKPDQGAKKETRAPLTLDLGDGVTVKLYGYVKADFIWDRGYELGDTTFAIKDIGTPGGPATGDFNSRHLHETRIGLEVQGPDTYARLEGDFFGTNGNLRLRHAYVDWKGLLIGQNWTNFMTTETLADTVDFQGAGAVPFARLPQIRYTFRPGPNLTVSGSIEEDIGNSDDHTLTLAARYGFDQGMVRASGLWRDATLAGNQVEGWALSLATALELWNGNTIRAAFTTGDGTADILAAGLSGTSVFTGGSTVGVNAVAISVSQQVSDKLRLAITGSWLDLDRAAATDTKKLESLHLSAFYEVHRNTTLGLEFFTGTRTQGDGSSFDVDRVQFAIKYAF